MLQECKLNLNFFLAGYNLKNLDRNEFLTFMHQNAKAYMTNKDVGIISLPELTMEYKEE